MKKFLVFLFLISGFFWASDIFAIDKVDINSASLDQLDALTGIGPKYAQAIIDARPFSSIDDLVKVKGIGEATLQKIKDQGLACVDCQQGEVRPPEPATAGETAVSSSGEVGPPKNYPGGVFINEIMPNPEGADETDEWVELYNINNFEVDLSGWKLQDTAGTIKTFTLPAGSIILANGFLVFKRPETKIMLNNDVDGLNLLWPNGKVIDSASYPKAPLGQSYSKKSGAWVWSTAPTPGTTNVISNGPSSGSELNSLQNAEKTDNSNIGTASLKDSLDFSSKNLPNSQNPWFLFFTTLATAVILAIAVLVIKLKSNKNNVGT